MRYSLTLYALKRSVREFDEAIQPDALANPELKRLEADEFDARLYSIPVVPTEPSWADFLREGFPQFEAPKSAMARAVVLLRIRIAGDLRALGYQVTYKRIELVPA